jgi:hypothetical protein
MRQRGQSLIEILTATGVIAVVVVGVASIIVVSLRTSRVSRQHAYAQTLLQDMISAVHSVSSQDWHTLWSSAKGQLYYAFDEGAGAANNNDRVIDPITGNNGTIFLGSGGNTSLSGAWHQATNCQSGRCLNLDGLDDYVGLASQPTLSGSFTIATWVKPGDSAGAQVIFDNNQTRIRKRSDAYEARIRRSDDTLLTLVSTTPSASGTWAFVASTWDGSTFRLYVDQGAAEASGSATSLSPTQTSAQIGSPFSGVIDEFRIYNRALSQSEIETLYTHVNKLSPLNIGGFWQIQEGTSTVTSGGTTYTRFFTIEAVQRSTTTNEIVSAGGDDDPATKKIVYTVSWPARTLVNEEYLTRAQTSIFRQTDWSGGATTTGPFIIPERYYETATSVNVTSTPGVIQLSPQ